MEDYKEYLEDFIKILKDEPKDNPNAFMELSANVQKELANAIENVLNKLQELENDLYSANEIISEQIDLLMEDRDEWR